MAPTLSTLHSNPFLIPNNSACWFLCSVFRMSFQWNNFFPVALWLGGRKCIYESGIYLIFFSVSKKETRKLSGSNISKRDVNKRKCGKEEYPSSECAPPNNMWTVVFLFGVIFFSVLFFFVCGARELHTHKDVLITINEHSFTLIAICILFNEDDFMVVKWNQLSSSIIETLDRHTNSPISFHPVAKCFNWRKLCSVNIIHFPFRHFFPRNFYAHAKNGNKNNKGNTKETGLK